MNEMGRPLPKEIVQMVMRSQDAKEEQNHGRRQPVEPIWPVKPIRDGVESPSAQSTKPQFPRIDPVDVWE